MPVRSLVAWLAILALAVLNGMLREAVLLPLLGKPWALLASGVILSALVLAVAIALAGWMGLRTPRRAVAVGMLWLALTLLFEFGFGIVQGRSWAEMLAPYTFSDGNIWPLVLVVVLLAPLIARRVSSGRQQGGEKRNIRMD